MKKFTKLFLSCALVSAMAVTAAASAFAEAPASVNITGGLTGKAAIDATTGAVTITDLKLPEGTTAKEGEQVTFLVFQGAQDVSAQGENVEGIDQGTDVQPTNNGLKSAKWVDTPTAEDVTTYTVMVGYTDSATNEFEVAKGTFTLTANVGETFTLGDVDGTDGLRAGDARCILIASTPGSTEDPKDAEQHIKLTADVADHDKLTAGRVMMLGDVDGDNILRAGDARCILIVSTPGSTEDSKDAGVKVTAARTEEPLTTE